LVSASTAAFEGRFVFLATGVLDLPTKRDGRKGARSKEHSKMTTRVGVGGPSTGVYETATAPRVTPAPAHPFQQVMYAGSAAIVNGAEAAVTHLPGGGILAAAMRPGASNAAFSLSSPVSASANNRPEGPTGTAGAGTAGLATSTGGNSGAPGSADPSIEQVMSQDADQNMYYLKLQEQMSAESRTYSAISNVLKARHDTMKNAIGNIR
jgi:hypothetical protein